MKKDITTKRIIKNIAKDIIRYIIGLEVSNISFIDKELQRVEKREADLVISCKKDNRDVILHIEIQNSNDNSMINRMIRYYADINTLYPKIGIEQYLIYIGKSKLNMENRLQKDRIDFSYNLIDMHNIDCEEMIEIDKPEALILAILCDFKDKDELEVLLYIIKRLKELSGDNEHKFGEYMLTLEILSTNRDLKEKLKEAEKMLRDVRYEELPSYEIGFEKGIINGKREGSLETKISIAKEMKASGFDMKMISKITKLDINTIKKL